MKAWLKGGIMGLIVFTILFVLSIVAPRGDMGNISGWILILPVLWLIKNLSISSPIEAILFYTVTAVPYIVIGALIGWIVGKIKSRR